MKFLQVEPKLRTYIGWNALPDLARFSLLVPGGVKVQSDGRIGLAQVRVDLSENRVVVSHAWGAGKKQDLNAATALVLTGFTTPPTVEFNGVAQTDLATHDPRRSRLPGAFAGSHEIGDRDGKSLGR